MSSPQFVYKNNRPDFVPWINQIFNDNFSQIAKSGNVLIDKISIPSINGVPWLTADLISELKAKLCTLDANPYEITYQFQEPGCKFIIISAFSNPVAMILESSLSLDSDDESYFDFPGLKTDVAFNSLYIASKPDLVEKIKSIVYSKLKEFVVDKNQYRADMLLMDSGPIQSFTTKLLTSEPLIVEAYPYLKDIEDQVEQYLASKQTIMMMQGPPGTGKTTLIKYIAAKMLGGQYDKRALIANVSSDEENIKSNHFKRIIDQVVKPHNSLIVFEDSDAIVQARESGNSGITPLFTIVDGLFAVKNKWIFTTNLSDIKKIDAALLRPGRCHSFIQTRALEINELIKLAERLNYTSELIDQIKTPMTLAEFFHFSEYKQHGFDRNNSVVAKSKKIGFV
jgi:DNA polymerase III delta prime subunit